MERAEAKTMGPKSRAQMRNCALSGRGGPGWQKAQSSKQLRSKDAEVTFGKELCYSYSYLSTWNFRTIINLSPSTLIITSVTVTTIRVYLKK